MTVRTTILGGTDWVDGEILYGTDLNDTFTGIGKQKVNWVPIGSGETSSTSYTDLQTVDTSAVKCTSAEVYTGVVTSAASGNNITGYFKAIVTLSDDSTDTVIAEVSNTVSADTEYSPPLSGIYNAPSGKYIKNIKLQGKIVINTGTGDVGLTGRISFGTTWSDTAYNSFAGVRYLYY